MQLLTDDEIDALAEKAYPAGGPRLVALRAAIREAVRLAGERAAQICEQWLDKQAMYSDIDAVYNVAVSECAAAIREASK